MFLLLFSNRDCGKQVYLGECSFFLTSSVACSCSRGSSSSYHGLRSFLVLIMIFVSGGFDTAHAAARYAQCFLSRYSLWMAMVWVGRCCWRAFLCFWLPEYVWAINAARAYDRAAIKFRGPDADINFNLSDYEEDMKQVLEIEISAGSLSRKCRLLIFVMIFLCRWALSRRRSLCIFFGGRALASREEARGSGVWHCTNAGAGRQGWVNSLAKSDVSYLLSILSPWIHDHHPLILVLFALEVWQA